MANNFRTIYLYTISLITLCMFIGGIVSTVNNIASYFYPDSYVFYDNDTTSSYDSTYRTNTTSNDYSTTKSNQIKQNNYKKGKIKNAVVSVVVIVVGAVMYKYHWNLIEKERVK